MEKLTFSKFGACARSYPNTTILHWGFEINFSLKKTWKSLGDFYIHTFFQEAKIAFCESLFSMHDYAKTLFSMTKQRQ